MQTTVEVVSKTERGSAKVDLVTLLLDENSSPADRKDRIQSMITHGHGHRLLVDVLLRSRDLQSEPGLARLILSELALTGRWKMWALAARELFELQFQSDATTQVVQRVFEKRRNQNLDAGSLLFAAAVELTRYRSFSARPIFDYMGVTVLSGLDDWRHDCRREDKCEHPAVFDVQQAVVLHRFGLIPGKGYHELAVMLTSPTSCQRLGPRYYATCRSRLAGVSPDLFWTLATCTRKMLLFHFDPDSLWDELGVDIAMTQTGAIVVRLISEITTISSPVARMVLEYCV